MMECFMLYYINEALTICLSTFKDAKNHQWMRVVSTNFSFKTFSIAETKENKARVSGNCWRLKFQRRRSHSLRKKKGWKVRSLGVPGWGWGCLAY